MPSRAGSGGRRGRRIFARIIFGAAFSLLLLVLVVFWLLPALARRGDLNALVEDAIRAALQVPVEIGNVETDPLSEFSLTRVSSVAAEAERRFQFACERLTAFYRPLELILGHRVRELTAQSPSLFLDLDQDLSGILRLPSGGGPRYQVDRFRIFDGRLTVRLGGRDFSLGELELDEAGLGAAGDLSFRAGASLGPARLTALGYLSRFLGAPGDPPRYRIEAAELQVEDLDLRPVLDLFIPPGLQGGGLFAFSGTAEGFWPERVEVRLSSAVKEAEARKGESPRLGAGEAHLEAFLTVLGEVDTVEFQVNFDGEGNVEEPMQEALPGAEPGAGPSFRERLSARIRGLFEKKPAEADGPRLSIEDGQVTVPGLGELTLNGELDLASDDPALDVEVRLPPLPLEALGEHAVGAPLRGLAKHLEGDLDLVVHAGGTLKRPLLSCEFHLANGALRLGGDVRIPMLLTGRAGHIELTGPRIEMSDLVLAVEGVEASVLTRLPGSPEGLDLRGKIRAEGRAEKFTLPAGEIEGELDFSLLDGSLSAASAGLEAPALALRGSAALTGDLRSEVVIGIKAALEAKELAIGPVVEEPGDAPITLEGEAALRLEPAPPSVRLRFRAETPSTGQANVEGSIAAGPGKPRLDLELRAETIPAAKFLGTWLRDAFQERVPLLRGSTFGGSVSLEARLAGPLGALVLSGEARSNDLSAKLEKAELEGVALAIPFRRGSGGDVPQEAPGFLRIGRLKVAGMDLEEVGTDFVLSQGAYRMQPDRFSLKLFGGTVEVEGLVLRPAAAEGERARLSFRARDLKLEEIMQFLGFPSIPGRAHLDARNFTLSGDRLLLAGRLTLDVFGGRVELEGLSVRHPFSTYRVYSLASGKASGIDLGALGRQFHFGIASGVLEGWVRDLVTTGSEVVGFLAEFETVRRRGVPQFINKAAIESIQRIVAGPFGILEQMFFSKFRYAGFGFRCQLENGRFRLRGMYEYGGTEHIMYSRWYQFPRVEIINTNPGIDYDWSQIFENLKSIYRDRREAKGDQR